MGTDDPWADTESSADMNYDPSGMANSTPTIPPPPNELPPPPVSRPKSSAPPPPQGASNIIPNSPPPPSSEYVEPVVNSMPQPVPNQSKEMSFPIREILEKIYCSRFTVLLSLGFFMLIIAAAYSNSAEWSNPPDMPVSSDFDLDDDGLSNAESRNYNDALDQYSDDLDEYNDKVRDHTGKTLFWASVGSAFIVGGLIGLAISQVEMSNPVRVVLLIGAIYMLGGLLGYQLPLTGASELALDFGG